MTDKITVEAAIEASIEKVWEFWINPEHITKWNNASPDWHTPRATNDLRVGGRFNSRMESVDGSEGFDFNGVYTAVEPLHRIAYTMEGGRQVVNEFSHKDGITHVVTTFDPEQENPADMQRAGWQSILDNFKKYVTSTE